MRDIPTFLIFVLILMMPIAYSSAPPPPLPDKFTGSVAIDNKPAHVGTEIIIFVDNVIIGEHFLNETGIYILYVKEGVTGSRIEFKILDRIAGNSTRTGTQKILDLSVNTQAPEDNSGNNDNGGNSGSSGGGGSGIILSPPKQSVEENVSNQTLPSSIEPMQKEQQVINSSEANTKEPTPQKSEIQEKPITEKISITKSKSTKGGFNLFQGIRNFFSGGNLITGAVTGEGGKSVGAFYIIAPLMALAGIVVIITVIIKRKRKV